MASFDPRMIQMHAGVHQNNMDHVGQRYAHQTGQHNDQQSQNNRLRQGPGATTAEPKTEAGPNWENVYRTAQNIGFPDPKVACGDIVGEFLEDLARGIGCPVEYILVLLLPCIGGILGTKTSIRVHRAWSEPPVLWSMVGSAAGSRRSAVIRQLLSPILALQADREEIDGHSPKQTKLQGSGHLVETKKKNSLHKRALYTGTRMTLTALTDMLHCNDGHVFSLAQDVENLHNQLMQPVTCPRLASLMDDLYEGLPLVAVEDGRVTTLLGTNFCHGGFASPEYIVRTMLKSPSWLSARFLLSCPQSDDMKGVFGEAVYSSQHPDLELIYSILLEEHQKRNVYTFDPDALQELNKFFEEEWTSVLNQLDQNEHECIISKSMGQIVRLCGILRAFENSLLSAGTKSKSRAQEWDRNITAGTVKKGIILGKYFMEQKLAMTFMVGTGFFNHSSEISFDSSINGNATTLPQTAIQVGSEQLYKWNPAQPYKWSPAPNTSRSFSQDSTTPNVPQGSQQNASPSFNFTKRAGDVDFSTLPHTMSTVEEDVSEMMQAVDFVHFSKTQFVAVHGRRIKRLLECYDDGHGVSATTAAQKSITPPVRIEGTNNRHPAWASALFFQKVAELDLGTAEQGRHPTNRKVCWRFKRKPVSQLQEKDFQLLQYLRVEMEKYSQFGSGPFNPSLIVNSGLITLPNSSSPHHQGGSSMSPGVGGMDDDSNTTNSQNSPRNSTPIIKTEIF